MLIPPWILIVAIIVNIVLILMNLDGKTNKPSYLTAISPITPIIPRLYFLIIYIAFWAFNIDADGRSSWGRLGNLAIFTVDSLVFLYVYYKNHQVKIMFYWYSIKERIIFEWRKLIKNLKTWRKT